MTEEQAAIIASERLAPLANDDAVIGILYDYATPGRIAIVVDTEESRARILSLVPTQIVVQEPGMARFSFKVDVELGPKIHPLVGNASHAPIERAINLPMRGGDPCFIADGNGWGTAGVFVLTLRFNVSDHVGNNYVINAHDCYLSNNHVIADLDARPVGTPLRVGDKLSQHSQAIGSRLAGFVPVGNPFISIDFAVGDRIDAPPKIFRAGELRGLGTITENFRNPMEKGETVHKSGARTGVTHSATTGRMAIRAPGAAGAIRWYYGVYRTGAGFSDHGDSGSIVVADNYDVLGMVTWGDDQNGATYFWTFGQQLPFSQPATRIAAAY